MKNTYKYILILFLFCVSGCSDDFLERIPKDKQTELTAFKTNNNFETYSWSLYNVLFKDHAYEAYGSDPNTDNMFNRSWGMSGWELKSDKKTPTSGGGWSFSYIRKVNLMLDHIDDSEMNDTDKDHWRSVGYFFRAYQYFYLMNKFGDVPWVEDLIRDEADEILYSKRTPRNEVCENVFEDFLFARDNIKNSATSKNVINVDCVNAVLSRFGLMEGTWRKHHGLGNEDKYINICIEASESLMAKYPAISNDYDKIFNSEGLAGMPGILLHRKFVSEKVTNNATRLERTSESFHELTKDMVNAFLCSNGKTIEANGRTGDEPNPYTEFRDRDHRLYFNTPPPYLVIKRGSDKRAWDEVGLKDGVDHSEYIRLMENIADEGNKRLPVLNWNNFVTTVMPHYEKAINGQGFCKSKSGYWAWKHYNTIIPTSAPNINTTDFAIFRMGEVLINCAEAKKEMGQFDQTVADATVNKLRARVGVAPMVISEIGAGFDVNRDQDVDPVMWEIRRERRIELLGEGFRFDDLRRWKKCDYILKRKVGAYIEDKNQVKPYRILLSNVLVAGGGTTGYSEMSSVLPRDTWPEYYYLYPIPKKQLILNENLEQNTGWEGITASE